MSVCMLVVGRAVANGLVSAFTESQRKCDISKGMPQKNTIINASK